MNDYRIFWSREDLNDVELPHVIRADRFEVESISEGIVTRFFAGDEQKALIYRVPQAIVLEPGPEL